MGGWTNTGVAGGGTVNGDLTVTGDLTVQGTTTSVVNQTISGIVVIDVDNAEAFLVRKDGDAGDVFVVDTVNSSVTIGGVTPVAGVSLLLPLSNDAVTPTLAFGTGSYGLYAAATNIIRIATASTARCEFNNSDFSSITVSGFQVNYAAGSSTVPVYTFDADTDTGMSRAAADTLSLITAGVEAVNISATQGVSIGGVTPVAGTRLLLPQEADAATPTLAWGDGNTGFYENSDNELRYAASGVHRFTFGLTAFKTSVSSGPSMARETASATNPVFIIDGNPNAGIGSAGTNQISLITNSLERWRITTTGTLQAGADALLAKDVNAGLTAGTTQTQAGGLALTAQVNEVSTVANTSDTVVLPALPATGSLEIEIINNGANTMRVFPASGDDLGAGADTADAVNIPTGTTRKYISFDATNWEKYVSE